VDVGIKWGHCSERVAGDAVEIGIKQGRCGTELVVGTLRFLGTLWT
jgi:hypothetical protein